MKPPRCGNPIRSCVISPRDMVADDSGPTIRPCGRVEGWMDWSQTALQPDFLTGIFWGFFRTPAEQQNWPAIKAELLRCEVDLRKLDCLLERRRFLLGDTLSLADIAAGTSLYRFFE